MIPTRAKEDEVVNLVPSSDVLKWSWSKVVRRLEASVREVSRAKRKDLGVRDSESYDVNPSFSLARGEMSTRVRGSKVCPVGSRYCID